MHSIRGSLMFLIMGLLPTLSGCALNPYVVEDPTKFIGVGPKVSEVVKSLRCEMITFIVENKLRSQIRSNLIEETRKEVMRSSTGYDAHLSLLERYKFIDIDSNQFASVAIDFKNVDTLNLTLGYDWKKPSFDQKAASASSILRAGDLKDIHAGPGYSDTRTFELAQTFAVPQNADLGSAQTFPPRGRDSTPVVSAYTTAYFIHPKTDEDFYCYKSLQNSNARTLLEAADEIQALLEGKDDYANFAQFTRIRIGVDGPPLARFFQDTASDMSSNQRTVFPTPENVLAGQIAYSFILDAKPSFDMKYTLVASFTNPLLPDINGSLEHSSSFSVYLNTTDASAALGAKNGTTCNVTVKGAACKAK